MKYEKPKILKTFRGIMCSGGCQASGNCSGGLTPLTHSNCHGGVDTLFNVVHIGYRDCKGGCSAKDVEILIIKDDCKAGSYVNFGPSFQEVE